MNAQERYWPVRDLVEALGGSMTWRSSRGGGEWVLRLRGRTAIVGCRRNQVNDLDCLFVPRVPHPKTWDDYDTNAPLAADCFWRLVRADIWRIE